MGLLHKAGVRPVIPKLPPVRVGWFPSAKYEDGTPVATVAAANEFGSGPVPPRPFMRPTVEAEREKWKKLAEGLAGQVVSGAMNGRDAMDLLGAKAAGDIRKTITRIHDPALSPRTIEARAARGASGAASDKPLVDTGFMLQTLTHEVSE